MDVNRKVLENMLKKSGGVDNKILDSKANLDKATTLARSCPQCKKPFVVMKPHGKKNIPLIEKIYGKAKTTACPYCKKEISVMNLLYDDGTSYMM